MGTLTLQMQTSVDGFVSAQRPALRWQVWDWGPDWSWDDELQRDYNTGFEQVDTVLLSRKMAEEGYVDHWTRTAEAHPHDPRYAFARTIAKAFKVVVTSRPMESRWPRTTIATGGLVTEVTALTRTAARVICFGGAGFASALVANGLVDEYQFFVNPTAVGAGSTIFASAVDGLRLQPIATKVYDCGIVVNRFRAS
ncbi:dihydrofolate reductase family protein [Plantactinospora endophytica]|uniref:Deaminase n=1 Tax=Plantactinospora endophytica TaxID=673535 RepID=A0ABQ4EE42_9ACTN|nr:dihydrofolate reductase family protein [Plantactinospora endophytica]GIG92998.1 deaminase [Plantactinospora endophytica]